MVPMDVHLVADSRVLSSQLGDDVIIMDVENGRYYSVTSVGARIWHELAVPTDVTTLCRRLEAAYDATPNVIQTSVLRFLDGLLARKLIRIEP